MLAFKCEKKAITVGCPAEGWTQRKGTVERSSLAGLTSEEAEGSAPRTPYVRSFADQRTVLSPSGETKGTKPKKEKRYEKFDELLASRRSR